MDNLEIRGGESQLRLHDACFDRCVNNLSEQTLDKGEQECVKNCFKSFALTFRYSNDVMKTHFSSAKANPHI